MKLLEFDEHLESADLVITGEGRMDFQSAYGKVVAGVAAHCKTHQIPCFALAGSIEDGAEALYDFGISGMMPLVDRIESWIRPSAMRRRIASAQRCGCSAS